MRNLILSIFILFSTTSFAEGDRSPDQTILPVSTTLKVDPSRLIRVLGGVDQSILPKAEKLIALTKKSLRPIYVMINSPGGSVRAGNVFIDAITIAKARGVSVRCFTTVYAASMGANILAECSERFMLPNATLLFHPVRVIVMAMVTAADAKELYDSMEVLNRKILKSLLEQTGMDEDTLLTAFYNEEWLTSDKLTESASGFITVIKNVTGIKDIFTLNPEGPEGQHQLELDRFGHVFINGE